MARTHAVMPIVSGSENIEGSYIFNSDTKEPGEAMAVVYFPKNPGKPPKKLLVTIEELWE